MFLFKVHYLTKVVMNKLILIIICFLFTLLIPVCANEVPTFIGKARDLKYEEINLGGSSQIKQVIEVELLSGENKKQIYVIDNILSGNPYYDINVSIGDTLVLQPEIDTDVPEYYITDVYRITVPIILALIFCVLILWVGRKKGFNSLISILFTIGLIYWGLRPLILLGISPLAATLSISLLSTVITMYLVGGFNRKSSAAIVGTILALFFAGIASLLTIKCAKLTGFADESMLYLYNTHPELSFTSITASIIILAALGAVMDVAMSIASTINEINETTPMPVKDLYKAGMNVGRDIIGTMANTLILVYMGGALPLLLLSSDIDTYKFFNLNSVVTEISSAIIGSIALLICVPLTAFVASYFIKFRGEKLRKRVIMEIETKIKR